MNGIAYRTKGGLDGRKIGLTAYTINNYNYFKLRDIAEAVNFGVLWSSRANAISIDTNTVYELP